MKAMLLTAGLGERMFPLTLAQPKPAIPVLGRPIVVQLLHWLRQRGVDEAVLNLHYFPQAIRAIVGEGDCPGLPAVRYSCEREAILGTAGGLRHAAELLRGDGPIVVCNSDFLSDIDLQAALETHRSSGCLATLVLAPPRPGYSVVRCDAAGRVISIGGTPDVEPSRVAGEHLFTGCHIIEEELLERIPAGRPSDIVRDVYRRLSADGRLGSVVHDGFWWEFGSPELYLDGCLRLLDCAPEERARISNEHDAIRALGGATVAVGPGAEIQDGVRFRGRAALGYSSFVSEGVSIEDSVVMPEAWIGPDCVLRRSIVAQGVELPAGTRCEDRVVCADLDPELTLPPGTRREAGMLYHALAATAAR
jgi:NDP-sugar pyrophosphorylase family protein